MEERKQRSGIYVERQCVEAQRGKRMGMKRDQRGFTIVELLIAVAILSIVIAAVCGFILVGSRSYAAGNSDISVQQEAQLALNQMSDVMIDTTRSVNYIGYDAGGDPVHALKDAEFAFTPEDKSLIMFNGVVEGDPSDASTQTVAAGNGNKHYHFYWSKADETLYYTELGVQPGDVDTSSIHFPAFDPTDPQWVKLAGHVTDFSVDLSQVEEKRVVQLALTFVDGKKEYVTSNNVTIRNKVGVNDAELAPLNRKVEIDVVVKPSVILEPGETFALPTPKVTGKNVTDKSVTWSFGNPGPSDDGPGSDTAAATSLTTDGILKLSVKAKGSFTVRATSNADSNSYADMTVNVKRVTGINLRKSHDSDPGNGPNEISPGCTFTVSGYAVGDFLDQTCDCCGEDTSIDHHILSTMNPFGYNTNRVWRVWDPHLEGEEWAIQNDPTLADWHPMEHIDMVDQDEYSATFYVHPDVPDGGTHGYQIQAVSLLSYHRPSARFYDWVIEKINFKVVKGSEEAEPFGGKLEYGEETLLEEIRAGLPTDHPKYVTAVRVVDNTGKEPDKVLLYFTTGGGNNYRISPDLFDLDLNGSYTFYMQAIDPVSYENRRLKEEGKVSSYIEDGADEIWKEYISNLSKSKPYGYVGTKYPYNEVYYAKLDKPKLTFRYNEVDYKGKNITCDPVDIYTAGKTLIPKFEPKAYENIEKNSGMNGMVYSVYEGKGSSKSQWNGLYYFDDAESVMEYRGNKSLADGAAAINVPKGDPFMQLNTDDNSKKIKLCGDYHIVPGMTYQNKDPGRYEIIGCDGFDFWHLPRKMRYYEFDDSTIHVKVDTMFNLELWSYYKDQNNQSIPAFTEGKIHFPTPSEAEFTSYFNPGNMNIEWQYAKNISSWWPVFVKSIKGRDDTTSFHPSSMRCHYVADKKVYELELFYEYYDSTWDRKGEVSAGVYHCAVDGTEWNRKTPGKFDSQLGSGNMNPQLGSTADVSFPLSFQLNGKSNNGKIYIPLPSEKVFTGTGWNELGFVLNNEKIGWQTKEGVTLKYLPDGEQVTQDVWIPKVKCRYRAADDEYDVILTQADENDSLIVGFSFKCKSDEDRWKQW